MASAIKHVIPMLDRVLVQRVVKKLVTKGGVLLPEDKTKKSLEGIVLAVGPGARDPETGDYIPVDVEEGDHVIIPEYGGTRIEVGGEKKLELLLFREMDILAKIDKSRQYFLGGPDYD